MENNNIEIVNGNPQVVYTKYGMGCMLFASGFMTVASVFILFLIPDMGILKALWGIPIGLSGTVLFGLTLFRLLSVYMNGKVLVKIENGYLTNGKEKVALQEIKDISFGWHSNRLSGMVFRDITVQKLDNKKVFFSYYNLVGDVHIGKFIKDYIKPSND